MPRIVIASKAVPSWTYPEGVKAVMDEFEALVERVREDVWKSGRNLRASRRARLSLQELRTKMIPKVRDVLFEEADRMEALRHGVSFEEWKSAKERERLEKREATRLLRSSETGGSDAATPANARASSRPPQEGDNQ